MEMTEKFKQESEPEMSFTISRWIRSEIEKIALTMRSDEDCVDIPGGHGAVLVRADSEAHRQRSGQPNVIKIPVRLKTADTGPDSTADFFVCTR